MNIKIIDILKSIYRLITGVHSMGTNDIINRLESAKEPIKAYLDMDYTSVKKVEADNSSNAISYPVSDNISNHFEPILIKNKGKAYTTIVPQSRYRLPLTSNVNYRGRSRIWGDCDLEAQERVIEDFIRLATYQPIKRRTPITAYFNKSETLTVSFISLCIAIMSVESGFNIDAAAGTTSAASLGQIVKKTGASYGITDTTLWDFSTNALALINHTLDNRDIAISKGLGMDYIYAYHHDGPSLLSGGLDISRNSVMPLMYKVKPLVETYLKTVPNYKNV